ncbi:hypothetical protein ATER59S_04659 [Aquamicrobium terrae]
MVFEEAGAMLRPFCMGGRRCPRPQRLPKIAEPTRTLVAPKATAVS